MSIVSTPTLTAAHAAFVAAFPSIDNALRYQFRWALGLGGWDLQAEHGRGLGAEDVGDVCHAIAPGIRGLATPRRARCSHGRR
jgi:hypothetical protein